MPPQVLACQEKLMPPSTQPGNRRYTWTDYQTWPDDERWELIDGLAYNMSPAPSIRHRRVASNFHGVLYRILAGKSCRLFMAPTDVRLSEIDVVQPDILVVSDPAKITPSHIEGAPELVVEVLSPGTSAKDLREKKWLYQRSGVREYLSTRSNSTFSASCSPPMAGMGNRKSLGRRMSFPWSCWTA